MPVTGNAGQSHAAVTAVSASINTIVNKKDSRATTHVITRVITNIPRDRPA
jgi:hypothetical protein